MARYDFKGQVIEINLSQFGHKGYFVEALYRFSEKDNKYFVSLFTVSKDEDGDIASLCQIADVTELDCPKTAIKSSIVKIVKMMCDRKLINEYLLPSTVMEGVTV